MVLCNNEFCSGEIIDFEYISLAGRSFCCIACAEDWRSKNEALAGARVPAPEPLDASEKLVRDGHKTAPPRTADIPDMTQQETSLTV